MFIQFQEIFISFLGGVFLSCKMFGCHNPYTPYMLWNIYLNKPTCTININQMQVNIAYMGAHG